MNTPARAPTTWSASYLTLVSLLVCRREALRTSQEDLAAQLGVGRRTLQRWEHGEAEPGGMRLFQWAAALGVSIAPHLAHGRLSPEATKAARSLLLGQAAA